MDGWDYLEVVGGFLLMIVCIIGNCGVAYLRSYEETYGDLIKRHLLGWLVITLVFCFFFVRKDVTPTLLEWAFLMPLKGLVGGQLLIWLWVLCVRHPPIAGRILVFDQYPRFVVTYERECILLCSIQTTIFIGWIYLMVR